MFHETWLGDETFARLWELDLELAEAARAAGCSRCKGRLDRADFPRKPRGVAEEAERWFSRRFGLCCSREGCRRRTLPPSVRFVGRHVYVGVVVVAVSLALEQMATWLWMQRRQARRWRRWWREVFGAGPIFAALRVRSGGAFHGEDLPRGVYDAVGAGLGPEMAMVRFLALVAGAPHAGGGRGGDTQGMVLGQDIVGS